jgi:hypothetical protein
LTQIIVLAKHSTLLPPQLTAGLHPMYTCQACNDDTINYAPMGPTSETDHLLPGTGFHIDIGFIRASSDDFGITPLNRVFTSYDGNNTYLLIVCAKARHTRKFCQASKSPPIFIIEQFLTIYGIKTGPIFLRTDQGGEFWFSNHLRDVAAAA